VSTEIEALRSTPFFADLPEEDLRDILRVAEPAAFAAGEEIVTEGDVGDAMYIVLSGIAEVDVGGRFHRLTAGDFFGEMALITAKKRLATVKAAEPVEVLRISAEAFQAFLLDHPRIGLSMMRALVERLREVEQRIDAWMAS
jgi:cAMP-binding proteins - catabolite gene activator and regulatory subunit of cAMP-dependent protein kinases